MLHRLPVEISLAVLSYLPLSTLCPLSSLSRKWRDFISANKSTIFHNAAILHEYIPPGTLLLEDALSICKGSPWRGATDWNDFCRRSSQPHKNWEGNGRVAARLLYTALGNVHRIKVDEKAGLLIATHVSGGLSVTHLFSCAVLWCLPYPVAVRPSAHCEYENGYLVYDCRDGQKEVWRLASDCAAGEVATHAPPDEQQIRTGDFFSAMYHEHAPRGHFRPWAKLSFPAFTRAYRLAYPTLLCASSEWAFLHDVRTGALVQTIDLGLENICYVDVNERYVFVCEPEALYVYSRGDSNGGDEVLCIPLDVSFSKVVGPSTVIDSEAFVSVLPLSPVDPVVNELPSEFIAAHVSRDGRDLVILTGQNRVLLFRDFERICRGETSLETSALVLHLSEQAECFYLAFEHGRVCVATSLGLHIFAVDESQRDSTSLEKVVLVQPCTGPVVEDESRFSPYSISCMQLTDRRVYFTWDDIRRRRNIPLFTDEESTMDISSPEAPTKVEKWEDARPGWNLDHGVAVGCIDFSLMPES